jgi:invasion protein IalB
VLPRDVVTARRQPVSGARAMAAAILAALALGLPGAGARAQEELVETIGAWTVECHQTEAGGRECRLRNDEDGRPALEQTRLLSFTLHGRSNDAEGLLRITDLEPPRRVRVELVLGGEILTIEGVGRRGRLAARFAMPRPELPAIAAADSVAVRFTDAQGQPHELAIPTAGLAEALAAADDFL